MNDEAIKSGRILVVDDDPANVILLERILLRSGHKDVCCTTDSREAIDLFKAFGPDLVLLDLHMPHKDGFEVLAELRPLLSAHRYLPVLVLTGDPTPEARERALSMGAKDFVTKPFERTEVLIRIRNLLETRFLYRVLESQNDELEARVRERTRELEEAQREILERLARAAEFRDDDTGQHAQRVGELAARIGRRLGLPESEVDLIRLAAPLHDLGKIGLPDSILLKPGRLSSAEFEGGKAHPTIGARILSGSRFAVLKLAEEIAWTHHERWDGTGYPRGLKGEEIPLAGRIVAAADIFDALTHERPYKPAWSVEDALAELERLAGTHLDPRVVEAAVEVIRAELAVRASG